MKIKYRVTMDDLVAFNIFHHRNSAFMKRRKMIHGVVLPVCYFFVFCIVGIVKHSWQPVVIAIIIFGSLMLWSLGTWEKNIKRNSRKMLNEGEETAVGAFELEITGDCLIEKGEHSETSWSWDSIGKIGTSPEHIFAYTSAVTAIIIPQAGLIEGSYAEFLVELKQLFEKMQSQEHNLTDKIIIDPKKTCHKDTRIGKQSGFGIASLVLSVLVGGLFLTVCLVMVVAVTSDSDASEHVFTAIGVIFVFGIVASLTGLGLGIAGLINKNRKKTMSVLGVVFNCIILVCLTILIAFGIALDSG